MINKTVKFFNGFVLALASVRAGFFFMLIGAISQTYHNYYIGELFSSFTGVNKIIQATFFAVFLGGGLIFYTIRSSKAIGEAEKDKYKKIVNKFANFEMFINLYYWTQKQVFVPGYLEDHTTFDPSAVIWYPLLMIIPLAILTPQIFKYYAGEVNIAEIRKENKEQKEVIKLTDLEKEIETLKNTKRSFKIIKNHNNESYDIEFIK